VTATDGLLLLDLDGVVVFESGPPLLRKREILRLHRDMPRLIAEVGAPVVVLTHRSRVEARHILQGAGVALDALAGLMAAEDLFHAGRRHAGWRALAGRGLRKSLILPVIERLHGVERGRIAFIDDRLDNLEDLLEAGLGLALHAPSSVEADALVTFDFDEAIARIVAWRAGRAAGGLVALTPVVLALEPWRFTGLNTRARSLHPFNLARAAARYIRRGLTAKAQNPG
jgi:hypothetical protein